VAGQAIPAVVPWQATTHFSKTECFCFQRQTLEGGESKEMPLAFLITPDLPEAIDTLTLSYTFMHAGAAPAPAWEPLDTQPKAGS
jgi:cytochrome c oxidase assembly protein subunit 11